MSDHLHMAARTAQITSKEDMNDFAPLYKLKSKSFDDTESMANTTAPATPMSNPTSSPQLTPSNFIQDPSFQPLMEHTEEYFLFENPASKRPAGHGNGDAYRYHDKHGALRYASHYASAGYVMDTTAPVHAIHVGAGGGSRLDGPCRMPCRHYGRDGSVVYR